MLLPLPLWAEGVGFVEGAFVGMVMVVLCVVDFVAPVAVIRVPVVVVLPSVSGNGMPRMTPEQDCTPTEHSLFGPLFGALFSRAYKVAK